VWFENRAVRGIFGPKKDEVTGEWRKLRDEERHILCSSPDIIFFSPATRHGGAWGERRYSSYSFTTSALDGVGGQRHASAALYPRGKDTRYSLYMRLGGPQSFWTQRLEEKSASAVD
jgi:hypothetical protein